MNFRLTASMLAAAFVAVSCSTDEVEMENKGNALTFNTSVSRANITTTSSLQEFKVWAYGNGFDAMFIDGMVAKRDKSSSENFFKFETAMFWPNDVDKIRFWAVSPCEFPGATLTMTPATQKIEDFTPKANPKEQIDLVVAQADALRSGGTSIPLTFHHALAQVEVKARLGAGQINENEEKDVWIKGAWLVNVRSSGDIEFAEAAETPGHIVWTPGNKKVAYGTEFTSEVKLTTNPQSLLASGEGATIAAPGTNMLLVPQQLAKWDLDGADKADNAAKGAYILVLCRVEGTHPGAYHSGATTDNSVKPEGNKHIHQLFPYTGQFDRTEYGYTCVPVSEKWETGKHYVYTLEFCGASSGAGVYPPTDDLTDFNLPTGGGKYQMTIPSLSPAKGVGDAVLNDPIRFKVEVADWTEGNTDTPMK